MNVGTTAATGMLMYAGYVRGAVIGFLPTFLALEAA
jgi:hypothetical protein